MNKRFRISILNMQTIIRHVFLVDKVENSINSTMTRQIQFPTNVDHLVSYYNLSAVQFDETFISTL